MHHSARDQIRNILILFGSATVLAVAIVAFMVHSYGPVGSYEVRRVLLAPETLSQLTYTDTTKPYEFDHIEVIVDQKSRKFPSTLYQALWKKIERDASIVAPHDSVEAYFGQRALVFSIWVRSPDGAAQMLQRLELSSGQDIYRVQLYDHQVQDQWVYFEHAGIYQWVTNLVESAHE